MFDNKIVKFIVLVIVVLIISFVFAVVDNGYENFSSYELGVKTGQMIKYFIKNLGTLALIVLTYRLFKENRSAKS